MEALEVVGRLITEARKDKYPSRRQFAAAAKVDIKTITTAESGKREIHPNTQRCIERALGWRKGSIEEVMDHRDDLTPGTVTVEEMERGAVVESWDGASEEALVSPASRLTDEELLAELSYRFRSFKVQAAQRSERSAL